MNISNQKEELIRIEKELLKIKANLRDDKFHIIMTGVMSLATMLAETEFVLEYGYVDYRILFFMILLAFISDCYFGSYKEKKKNYKKLLLELDNKTKLYQ